MNKRILLSFLTIIAVLATVSGATIANYNDTETSENNTFAAGTLDLTVDDKDDPAVVTVTVDPVKPGWGDTYYWTLKNVGSIAGKPSIEFGAIDNYDNACTEPEDDLDTTCGNPGLGEGELGGKLYIQIFWSNDGGATWKPLRCSGDWGNHLLNTCGGKTVGLGAYSMVGPMIDTAMPVLNPGDTVQFKFHPWWHSTGTDNIAQSDSAVFDIIFHLDQS